MTVFRLAATFVAVSVMVGCGAERSVEPVDGLFVFEGARLITGDSSAPIEDGTFVVRDGVIEEVGATVTIEPPRGASSIDLSGKTVMPLIVNVHGHVGYMKGRRHRSGALQPRERGRPSETLHLLRGGRRPIAGYRSGWRGDCDPRRAARRYFGRPRARRFTVRG